MRVLVTGSEGAIGRAVVRAAARGCHTAVHLAAIPSDRGGTPEEIVATNVLGTWHVLLAARSAGLQRVVSFSSIHVLGVAEGQRAPTTCRSTTTTRATRGGRTACPSASPRTCARPSPPTPA